MEIVLRDGAGGHLGGGDALGIQVLVELPANGARPVLGVRLDASSAGNRMFRRMRWPVLAVVAAIRPTMTRQLTGGGARQFWLIYES